jgi:hypothetical protein
MDVKSTSGAKIKAVILTLQKNGIVHTLGGGNHLFRDENREYGIK